MDLCSPGPLSALVQAHYSDLGAVAAEQYRHALTKTAATGAKGRLSSWDLRAHREAPMAGYIPPTSSTLTAVLDPGRSLGRANYDQRVASTSCRPSNSVLVADEGAGRLPRRRGACLKRRPYGLHRRSLDSTSRSISSESSALNVASTSKQGTCSGCVETARSKQLPLQEV